jgi:anti-anti-sigma regulatory factor
MSRFSEEATRGRPNDRTVVAQGNFDGTAAAELQALVSGLPQATQVLVDLHEAHEISDCALAVFAQWATGSRAGQLRLIGLSTHHQRLLRYVCPSGASLCAPSGPLTEAEVN